MRKSCGGESEDARGGNSGSRLRGRWSLLPATFGGSKNPPLRFSFLNEPQNLTRDTGSAVITGMNWEASFSLATVSKILLTPIKGLEI